MKSFLVRLACPDNFGTGPSLKFGIFDALANVVNGVFNRQAQRQTNNANLRQVKLTNLANLEIANRTNAMHKQLQDEANAFNLDMWYRTNEYNSPIAERERLKAAGLNPLLAADGGAPASDVTAVNPSPLDTPVMQPAHFDPALLPTNITGIDDNLGINLRIKKEEVRGKQLDNEAKQFNNDHQEVRLLNDLFESAKRIDNLDANTEYVKEQKRELANRIDTLIRNQEFIDRKYKAEAESLEQSYNESVERVERAKEESARQDLLVSIQNALASHQIKKIDEDMFAQYLSNQDWYNELDRVTKRFKMEQDEHQARMDLLDIEKQFKNMQKLGFSKEQAYKLILLQMQTVQATEQNRSKVARFLRKKFGIDLSQIGNALIGAGERGASMLVNPFK